MEISESIDLALSLGWSQKQLDAIRRTLRPDDRIGRVTGRSMEITRPNSKLRAYNEATQQPWRRIMKITE